MLQGEGVEFLGRAADALIAISNYRLHIKFKDSVINVSSCLVFLPPKSEPYCASKWYCSDSLPDYVSENSWDSLLVGFDISCFIPLCVSLPPFFSFILLGPTSFKDFFLSYVDL